MHVSQAVFCRYAVVSTAQCSPVSRSAFRCRGETVYPHRFRNSSLCWRKTSATSSQLSCFIVAATALTCSQ